MRPLKKLVNALRRLALGRRLDNAQERNREAARRLDRAVREVLKK